MRFTNTSATTFADLLIAIRNHLSTYGWTILADNTGAGTPSLEVTNGLGNSFILSTSTSNHTDAVSGAFTNRNLTLAYQKSDIGLAAGYSAAVGSNDFNPPFSNVWIISDNDATYCHVIVQVGTARYSHMSFGNLDNRGIHSAEVSYICGLYYEYWRNSTNPADNNNSRLNQPSYTIHQRGFTFENSSRYRLGIPDGLLDPALNFTDGALDGPAARTTCSYYYTDPIFSFNNATRLLDYFSNVTNDAYTGGVNIAPLPCVVYDAAGANAAYIGDVPGVGMVNMFGLSPGQVLTFGSEEWIVFPQKQMGSFAATVAGSNPINEPNTVMYGYAYRKA